MPLYKIIHVDPATKILLWKITESYQELLDTVDLKEKSTLRLKGMRSELHRRGFMSVRKLLQECGYSDFDLHYDIFGKPYFEDGRHISISHSHEFSTIILSDKIAGIDMEMRRDKIAIIADRFLSEREWAYLDKNDPDLIRKLTVLWGIKEAVYKIRNEPGISFKEHINAPRFELTDHKAHAILQMEHVSQLFTIYFEEIENFTLVYAFENH